MLGVGVNNELQTYELVFTDLFFQQIHIGVMGSGPGARNIVQR